MNKLQHVQEALELAVSGKCLPSDTAAIALADLKEYTERLAHTELVDRIEGVDRLCLHLFRKAFKTALQGAGIIIPPGSTKQNTDFYTNMIEVAKRDVERMRKVAQAAITIIKG